MTKERRIASYADALFAAQRGFLIVGLTGYTGSGCTTTARVLSQGNKIDLSDAEARLNEGSSDLSKRHFKRLQAAWGKTPWESFTVVEVAVVIFALLAKAALEHENPSGVMKDLQRICSPHREALAGLGFLSAPLPIADTTSSSVVESFEKCKALIREYKASIPLIDFVREMQLAGDKIRLFGTYEGDTPSPQHMLVLPEAIRKIISAYKKNRGISRFVVDSFRNPFEVEYFKRRYAEFYLVAIFKDKDERLASLLQTLDSEDDIKEIWKKEDGDIPAGGMLASETPKTRDNIGWWVTGQNIPECVQKADMFIVNSEKDHASINFHLAKLLSLAHKPGCLTPTDDERGMQIASTVRLMSGCLSRQVGAAIIGPQGYVVGIGWNDPPDKQVPCALRVCGELSAEDQAHDRPFSEYERSEAFRRRLESRPPDEPFCFRAELAAIKNKKEAEYTRALHAEENAFLQTAKVGGATVVGSTLYTTSSTCTLCAKKAYQLEVKRVIYIERYPDLAYEQTIMSGAIEIRYEQFEGIAGSAFFALYSPLMPEKDLIAYYS